MCQYLRANADAVDAFGDTWDSSLTIPQNDSAGNVSKFWSDYASQQPDDPYLVFQEIGETYSYMTRVNGVKSFTASGQAICRIYQRNRNAARQLGILVADALNDADIVPLEWPAFKGLCQLMQLRMGQASFQPLPDIAPGLPSVFNRVLVFQYDYQGYI